VTMSSSRLWRFFKRSPTQLPNQQSQYGAVDQVDNDTTIPSSLTDADDIKEAVLDVRTDESLKDSHTSLVDEFRGDNVTIEEIAEQVEKNKDTITAWQVVTSLSTIVFAPENRPRILAAAVLTTINTALNYVTPYLLGKMIDPNDRNVMGYEVDTVTLTLMLITAGTLSQYLPNIRDRILAPVSSNNMRQVLTRITDHQLNKSLDYHSNTQFGDQVYLIQKGFSSAETGIPLLTQVAPTLFEMIMAVGVLSYRYGAGMGAGIAGAATIYTAYTWLTTPSVISAREDQRKKGNITWEKISGALKQYKNIHDFGKYSYEMDAIRKSLNDYVEAEIHAVTTSLKIGQGHIAIPRLGMVFACLYVAKGLVTKEFTHEDFILLVTYLDKLATLVPTVGKSLNDLFATWPDLKFLFNELLKPSEIKDPYPNVPLITNGQSASIRFENVTFGYPKKPPIFRNLSFNIEGGETAAFVSQSGGGKSTIFKLLFRYNIPSEGNIYVNDQDISKVSLKSLRENVGLIAQNPNLFNGTVRENIRYGAINPDKVTDAEIWALAEKANLTEFLKSLDRGYSIELVSEKPKNITDESKIYVYLKNDEPMYSLKLSKSEKYPAGAFLQGRISNSERVDSKDQVTEDDASEALADNFRNMLQDYPFPVVDKESKDKLLDLLLERNRISEKRLDNSVGEDGKALSGGEQQRVAILRGLLKASVIRPLDEITSALDVMTADKVLGGIHEITLGQTKLVITHKLAESQFADTIIVINKGMMIAQGKHEDLLNSCSLYKTLWDKQNKKLESMNQQASRPLNIEAGDDERHDETASSSSRYTRGS
jgi:ABC-type transport system involved in Fe-S cluster assembly fused permease/ATPase subunit